MQEIASQVEKRNFDTFLPVGEDDDAKIKVVNDDGISKSDGLLGCLGHGAHGWLTLGVGYEIFEMLRQEKPVVLYSEEESYLPHHYLFDLIDNLHLAQSLDEAIDILEQELNPNL